MKILADIRFLLVAFFTGTFTAAFFSAAREFFFAASPSIVGIIFTFVFCMFMYSFVGGIFGSWAIALYYVFSLLLLRKMPIQFSYGLHTLFSFMAALAALHPESFHELAHRSGDNWLFSMATLVTGIVMGPCHCFLRNREIEYGRELAMMKENKNA
jgi:hypothetical protein